MVTKDEPDRLLDSVCHAAQCGFKAHRLGNVAADEDAVRFGALDRVIKTRDLGISKEVEVKV